jgi:phosphoglycolate phosphatase-like HAD superfamily hydrolase
MIRHFLFDFDGVLIDSAEIKAAGFIAVLPGLSPNDVRSVHDYVSMHGGVSRFVKFRYIYERILGAHLPDDTLATLCNRYSQWVYARVLAAPEIPGVAQFLAKLSPGQFAYVVSGTPQDELRELIRVRTWGGTFAEILGSPTPKADLVRDLVGRQSMDREETVFFGDSITDLEAAEQSFVPFVGIGTPWVGARGIWYRDFTELSPDAL